MLASCTAPWFLVGPRKIGYPRFKPRVGRKRFRLIRRGFGSGEACQQPALHPPGFACKHPALQPGSGESPAECQPSQSSTSWPGWRPCGVGGVPASCTAHPRILDSRAENGSRGRVRASCTAIFPPGFEGGRASILHWSPLGWKFRGFTSSVVSMRACMHARMRVWIHEG